MHVMGAGTSFVCLNTVSDLSAFLFQVRRMVGALVAVGQNRFEPHHIQKLLEIRDLLAYPQNAIAPAHGLFLKDVEYSEAGERLH